MTPRRRRVARAALDWTILALIAAAGLLTAWVGWQGMR